LVFSPFVRTAITTTRHTLARPRAFAGRDTFSTASAWAWAHGPGGATATAGAAIGSSRLGAEAIAAAVAQRQRVDIQAAHGLAQVVL